MAGFNSSVQFNDGVVRLAKSRRLDWLKLSFDQRAEIAREFEATLPKPAKARPLLRRADGGSVGIGGGGAAGPDQQVAYTVRMAALAAERGWDIRHLEAGQRARLMRIIENESLPRESAKPAPSSGEGWREYVNDPDDPLGHKDGAGGQFSNRVI
jgi:hypothetical protein